MNIRIQVINPGFVDTPLTEKNILPMPGLMPVDRAARRMARGVKPGGFEVTFPRRFTWPLKVLSILPQPLRFRFINRMTGWAQAPAGDGQARAARARDGRSSRRSEPTLMRDEADEQISRLVRAPRLRFTGHPGRSANAKHALTFQLDPLGAGQ